MILLITPDGEVGGFSFMKFPSSMTFERAGNKLLLHTVCIYRKNRGKGYCVPFLKNIIDNYKEHSIIELDVDVNNDIARKCYKKAGFREDHIRMKYD
jgi:RimJ/RimL family protein N-acetyltransferase